MTEYEQPARTRTMRTGALAAGLGVLLVQSAFAQSPDSLNVDLGDCVELESPEDRFACYESRVDEAREQSDSAAPPAAAEAREKPAEDAQNERPRGAAERSTAARSAAHRDASQTASRPDEIVGTIESVRERLPNAYVIRLANGQVWQQTNPKFYPLRPGQTVRLRSTGWGPSYRLSTEERGGFIQVEQVR